MPLPSPPLPTSRSSHESWDTSRAGGEANTPSEVGDKQQLHDTVHMSLCPSLRLFHRDSPEGTTTVTRTLVEMGLLLGPGGPGPAQLTSHQPFPIRRCGQRVAPGTGCTSTDDAAQRPLRNDTPVPPRASPQEAIPGHQTHTPGHTNSRSL